MPPSPSKPIPPGTVGAAGPTRVLVADDQPDVLAALRLVLKAEGFAVTTAGSPAAILTALEHQDFDVLLMDLNYTRDTTSGAEGLDLLRHIQTLDSTLPVVVMTAWGSVEGAVEAMRRGARDYLQKPWDNTRLTITLNVQAEFGRALRQGRRLADHTRRQQERELPEFIAFARSMQPALRIMERVAPSDANILITGEHGTGKEVVARWLHAASGRRERPFVALNAGGLGEGVFESELFGHVRGAFTDAKSDRIGCFEMADGGTLFLDEIGNMPAGQQAKLLRVLQTGEFHPVGSSKTRHCDVRVLAATNADIGREVAAGRFREDLLYRINTIEIHLPPLRERREDIPPLAVYFLRRSAGHYGKTLQGFTPAALTALVEYPFTGNVRELAHIAERAVLLAQGEHVDVTDLLLRPSRGGETRLEEMTLEEAEAYLIRRALDRAGGSASEAARLLGLSRSALYRRLQQYGIKVGE